MQLQFQDRVSQILNHVNDNILYLPTFLQQQTGTLTPLDAQEFLADLKKTYVMADQHLIHSGAKAVQKIDTEITFF